MNMKLTGNKRKGNHLGKTAEKTAAENVLSDDGVSTDKKKLSKKKKIIIIVLASILALAAGVTAYAYFFIRSALSTPPPVRESPRGSEMIQVPNASNIPARQSGEQTGQESPDDDDVVETPRGGRDMTKYTFLILGTDLGDFNTDVIMVATLDTTNNTLIITNIPRDTMANVSWDLKKANSILSNMRLIYRGQDDFDKKVMDATVEAFSDILGFKVDYWVHVNMRAFISLINAIDGVDFYVPVNMNYDDPAQNLSIHYSRGMHHLYGQQALEVLRFRSGYSNADIGRIGTQQEFLKSAAEQILAKKSSINILELADIFIGNVKTDISLDNLIWFGRELLRLEVDNIIFQTLPGLYIDYVGAQSYVTIFVDEWLEMINSTVSPFYDEITKDDVSILTRGEDRYLYVTDGNRLGNPSWGANSRGPDPNNQDYWSGPTGTTSGADDNPYLSYDHDEDDIPGYSDPAISSEPGVNSGEDRQTPGSDDEAPEFGPGSSSQEDDAHHGNDGEPDEPGNPDDADNDTDTDTDTDTDMDTDSDSDTGDDSDTDTDTYTADASDEPPPDDTDSDD